MNTNKIYYNDFFALNSKELQERIKDSGHNIEEDFHRKNVYGKINDINEVAITDLLKDNIHMFVYQDKLYVYKDGHYQCDSKGKMIMSVIKKILLGKKNNESTRQSIYKSLLSDYDLEVTEEEVNDIPDSWIVFKNMIFDLKTGEIIKDTFNYKTTFFINTKYYPDKEDSNIIIEFLRQFCEDEENYKMLMQFISLCFTITDKYKVVMFICGGGDNGKSLLNKILTYIIGRKNVSNTPIEKIKGRFGYQAIEGKLLNVNSELKRDIYESDMYSMKSMSGGESLEFEQKFSKAHSANVYAKFMFMGNYLPTIDGYIDKAFLSRLLIINTEFEPDEKDVDYFYKLQEGVNSFITEVLKYGRQVFEEGTVYRSDDSKLLVEDYEKKGGSLDYFLEKYTIPSESDIKTKDLRLKYNEYLNSINKPKVTGQEFNKLLRENNKCKIKKKSSNEWYLLSTETVE